MKKRLVFLFTAIFLLLMMLSACGSNTKTTEDSSNTPSSSKKSDIKIKTSKKDANTNGSKKDANTKASKENIVDIKVMAKDFEFDKKEIHVKKGEKVRITLQSDDGGHGFAIPVYNVDIQGNKSAEFIADKKGTFEYHCSIACGLGHSSMTGKLIVE